VRLVACANCHTQYDVTGIAAKTFPCRCGETVENRPPQASDAAVQRCGGCGALVAPEAASCAYCGAAIVRDTGHLSLICPECYARNADESRFCTACGVPFRPEPVQAEGVELPCPVCSTLMPSRQVGGFAVNECRSCNGLWTPGESFDAMIGRAIEARKNADPTRIGALQPRVTGSNPAAQRVQYRKCPVCDAFMHRRNFRKSSGVIIDRCAEHGTWLDADELEQIAGFILSGGSTSPVLRQAPRPRLDPRGEAAFARLRARGTAVRPGAGERSLGASIADVLSGLLETLS
jgi:Zn-finger nucleic acid-binding protein